jgi:hypothetical protein
MGRLFQRGFDGREYAHFARYFGYPLLKKRRG